MKKPVRILIVEDQPDDADLAKHEIYKILSNCEFLVVETRESFIRALEVFQPDIVLSDYTLPHFDGMKALELTLKLAPSTPFIIWTGSINEDVAVGCVKAGASNYILKDNLKRLGAAVLHALEEKELLAARRQAEQKYKSIFENSMEGIFQSSPEGRYINVNPAMARLYGYHSPAEMVESVKSIADQIYVNPTERAGFIRLLHSQNTVEHYEQRNYRRDGSVIWTSTSARAVRDENGNLLYYEGFVQDITQRKEAKEALQNSERRFRSLIENGLDDISLLEADGSLLWESPSTIRNLGYVPGEFVGRNIFEMMHPEDLEWTREAFAKLLQEPGARQRGIFRLRRADGAWRWVEAIATNLLNEASVNAIVINYRDITEQKQAEIELQQKNADLALINALNEVINRGEPLDAVLNLLRNELKRIFSSEYTNIYLLDPDRQSIRMEHYSIPPTILRKIEKVIGRALPAIEIPVQKNGFFQSVLRAGHGMVINGPESIQKWMGEFAETNSLSTNARAAIRKLLPQIQRILNIKSTILVPLISDGKTLGLLNVSGAHFFTQQDLKRIENICGHLTAALRRKQVEEALRESQARYQNLVETSHDLIWSVDAEGKITFLNRAAKEIYGYEPEELIGHSFTEIMDSENTLPLEFEKLKEFIGDANEFKEVENRVRHRDGRQIILSANSKVLRSENGQITGIVGSSHDITNRKQSEEILKEERNLLRTLIDNIPDRIYAMDKQGRKTLSNAADWKASGGKTMEAVIGKTDFDTYPPDLAEQFWEFDKTVLESGQPIINYEEPGLDPDGSWVSILTTKIPLRNNEGNVIGLVGIGRDITERKHAEEALRQSQNQYRTLIETQTEFIVRWRPDGTRTFANEAYCRYFGLTPEQALSNSFMPLIHEEDRQTVERKIHLLLSGASNIELGVHRVIKPDGTIGWQEWIDQAIRDENGKLIELQSVGRDITERRQAEIERQALLEIMQGLANTKDLHELLKLVHHSIAKVIYAENFFVVLHQKNSGLFEEIYSVDQYDPPAPPSKLEDSITSYVFRSGNPLLLSQTSFDELAEKGEVKLIGTDSASWLGVPLKTSGRTIGVIAVQDYENNNRYSEHDRDFLASIAAQVALAIERKQAEEALRESEEHYRTIFEGVQDAIFVESLDGKILMVNERACEMFGYSQAEFLTKTVADIVPPGSSILSANEAAGPLSNEPRESYNLRATGEIFPIEISGRVQVINDERVLLIVVRDITERKRAEAAEREQRILAQALLDTAKTLNSTLDYGEVLDYILTTVGQVVPHDAASILLIEGEFARVVRSQGYDKHGFDSQLIKGIKLLLAETANLRQILETKQPVVVYDTHSYPGWQRLPSTDWLRSSVGAPISIYGEVIGFICLDSQILDFFNPVHAKRLEAFTNQAALAIHNARLLQQAQEEITERKLAEAELRASEERFRQLAENIQEAFWMTEAENGREIYMSPAVETIWGRSIQSLMYAPNAFINSVYSEDRPAVLHAIEKEKSGEKVQLEYRIVRPDGTLRWIWDRAFPIFDDSGNVRRIAGISADITERMQSEQELRKLSRAVEQSGSTIVITDTSGNIEYVNPKFTEITGYSYDEAIGQNPRMLKSGFTAHEEYKQLWETISSGREWHGELLNKKRDGTLYWESVTISPILNDRKEITHYVGVQEDITERKQSEIATRRHIAELEAVYENGLSVGRLLEPSEIGNRVIETFARYLPWHHVTIRLRKEGSDDLELVSFNLPNLKEEERANTEQHFIARINKVGQGLSGWVIQTGMALRTGNVHAHPQYIDTHAGIQSGLYMPLKVGERAIGVISVESEASNAFTEQDERLLATLANQTAIAFENARLYEAMQKELLERKRVEEALRISETHYRALADSITDILFELDQDLRYTHWNKASEALTGIPAKDAIGKSLGDLLGISEEQTRITMIYENVLSSQQPRTFETTLIFQGEKRSFETTAYPSSRGVSVVAKDVTDRKRTETILQKRFELMEYSAKHSLNELMLRTVDEVSELTGSALGFFHFMDEDQVNLGMQTWSTNALRGFHLSSPERIELPLDQAGLWAEAIRQRRPLIHNDFESLVKREGVPQIHVPIVREIVIPIIRNERIMAVMGIANKPQDYTHPDLEIAARLADYAWDITERKQMEIALEVERNQLVRRVEERTADLSRANSNLARALRVKDEFLANMSHELRTPLNAILGLSESLGEQIAGPLNEKQQKYISTISESGHHLLSLINDILDLAKIEAGQITLDINKVDIHSVCQASLRMIKQLAQKKNQEISLEIDPDLGLMWADERRLKQMIVNLLGNAVKFTPENGRLGLGVHGDEEANQIAITVWDNGIGIKQDDLARLFQPFVQLDSGLAREATGTGLGLALVAQMARLHGGSVNAVSEAGKGSRFTIILPWEPALAVDTASRMRITGKFRAIQFDEKNKPTILLVEDTKEVVMMLRDYLELIGYKVFTAQDGVDGIVQAQHVKPDLILMDIQMPRMDGFETTRKLRSDPNFRYTPIIALTALAMPHDRERCLEAGMDEYISKPVNLKALIKVIQHCLFERELRTR